MAELRLDGEKECIANNEDTKEEHEENLNNFVDSSESGLDHDSKDSSQPVLRRWCSACSAFVLKHFLSVCMITFLVFGALVPAPGVFMSKLPSSYVAVSLIFFFNGVTLKTQDLKSALKEYKPLICAVVIILAITPIIGAKLTEQLPYGPTTTEILSLAKGNTSTQKTIEDVFGPAEVKIGFQVYFLMPCTIVTCIVMVTQLGGEVVLTMLISVITNILAIFIVPYLLNWLTSFNADVKLDVEAILLKLVLTVLLPVVVGKLSRFIERVQRTADNIKKILKRISVVLLCLIPWMKVSVTSDSNMLHFLSVPGIFICIGWATLTHILFLFLSILIAVVFRFERQIIKTLAIVGSQKTLVLAVSVMSFLPPEAGDQGLIAVPAIVAHLSIVLLDSLLIACVSAQEKKSSNEELELDAVVAEEMDNVEDVQDKENPNCYSHETSL